MQFQPFTNQILNWLVKYLYMNDKDEVEVRSRKKEIADQ